MASKHTFQTPRGTRDFYPEDMAIRRYIESVWREVSINHGFEEIEGPMFEHLDLYKIKSGEGIVSELFSFTRAGGETEYALRPEFTPTLARMYAARARQLPKPTKWFVIPNHFRAERPQRGRLREFMQWNIDVIGGQESEEDRINADVEVIGCTIDILSKFGLSPDLVKVRLTDRRILDGWAENSGILPKKLQVLYWVWDNFDKLTEQQHQEKFDNANISTDDVKKFKAFFTKANELGSSGLNSTTISNKLGVSKDLIDQQVELQCRLDDSGYVEWCKFDSNIMRGLAYYTGTVFEIITKGERAIAGGGRYDHLIELVGGPPTSAVGIAMGDVVLRLVLEDNNLLGPDRVSMPRPDVFVISLGDEKADTQLKKIVAQLRSNHLHVRHTYKATRKLKKLLGEAEGLGSRLVVILDEKLAQGEVTIKDMKLGSQEQIQLDYLRQEISDRLNNT